jgi:hypothetical protein
MTIGFAPEEIRTAEPTRSARLKWVVVVNSDLAPGLQVNAVACVAAATAASVSGLLASGGRDADGRHHAGLPWAGCTVLAASTDQLVRLWEQAGGRDDVLAIDMPAAAQSTRVYDEFLEQLSKTDAAGLDQIAMSLVGPRNAIDRMVKRLPLL